MGQQTGSAATVGVGGQRPGGAAGTASHAAAVGHAATGPNGAGPRRRLRRSTAAAPGQPNADGDGTGPAPGGLAGALEPAEPPADLSSDVRAGLRWSVISQLAVRLVSVASGIVLLRLLLPEEYGVYAFALAVVNILVAFNDLGQVLTIARWPGDVAHAARTSTTLTLATSAVCFVACVAAAPLLAEATDRPEATGVLRLLACMILVDAVTTVPRALLFRAFKHRRTAIGDLVGTAVNVAVALSLAAAGAGTWAPAVGTIAAAMTAGTIVLASAPQIPLPGWDPAIARKLMGFGVPLAFTTLVELTLLNVDYLIVARELGATALGLYAVAFNVSSWPSTLLTQAIRGVSVAGFAKLGPDREQLADSFVSSFRVLVTLLLPVCAALAVLSEPLLRVLYGERIAPAAWALTWLVTLGGTRVAVGLVFDLLLSQGRSRTTFRLQLVWLVAVVPALAVGANLGGITGVALAHMGVALVIALPIHLWAARDIGVSPARLAESLTRPALGVIGAVAVGLAAAGTIATPAVALVLGGAVMTGVYFAGAVTPTEARQLLRLSR